MAKQKSDYIVRRLVESTEYDIYQNTKENGLVKLGSEVIKGKIKTSEIAEKYGIHEEEVVTVKQKVNNKVYGVKIADFMAIAKDITEEYVGK